MGPMAWLSLWMGRRPTTTKLVFGLKNLWTTKSYWNDIKWLQIAIPSTDSERAHRDASNEKAPSKMVQIWTRMEEISDIKMSLLGHLVVFFKVSQIWELRALDPPFSVTFQKQLAKFQDQGAIFLSGGGSRFWHGLGNPPGGIPGTELPPPPSISCK